MFVALRRLFFISSLVLSCLFGTSVFASSDVQPVRFRQGSSKVDENYRDNAASLEALDQLLAETGKQPLYIMVRAASSPDGTITVNRRLARARARQVVEALKARHPELPDSLFRTSVLEEDWTGAVEFLRRSRKPYAEEAIQIIQSGSPDTKVQLQDLWVGEAWDYLTWNWFPRLRKADIVVAYGAEPASGTEPAAGAEAPFRLVFPQGRSSVSPKYQQNNAVLEQLAALLKQGTVPSVTLRAYASPEGTVSKNEALAKRRAAAVRDYLVKEQGLDPESITIESMGEDWAGFREAVIRNYSGAYLPEILSILDHPSYSAATRKRKLQALDNGSVWQGLIRKQMKGLRAVEIVLPAGSAQAAPPVDITVVQDTATAVLPKDTLSTQPVVISPVPTPDTLAVVSPPDTISVEQPEDSTRVSPVEISVLPPAVRPLTRPILGVNTNLAFDALTAVNLGLEVPLGRHWDLTADVYFPWWTFPKKDITFQWVHADLGARYYFKGWQERETSQVCRGLFAGVAIGGGFFNVGRLGTAYQGEELSAKLRLGYTFRFSPSWRMNVFAGAGAAFTQYRPYDITANEGLVPPVRRMVPIPDLGLSFTYFFHTRAN